MSLTRRSLAQGLPAVALAGNSLQGPTPEIHIRLVGEGDRLWVLLHPLGASGRFWEARAGRLAAEHGVRVAAPDLPGHGRSSLSDPFSYEHAARAILLALGEAAKPSLVIGASSGGLVGLMMAARISVPAVAIGVGDAFTPGNLTAMSGLAADIEAGSNGFVEAFLEQGEVQRVVLAKSYRALADRGSRPFLDATATAALAGRTLLINGTGDDFFLPEAAHRLNASIPRSLLTFVEGAGHLDVLAPAYSRQTWAMVEAFDRALSPRSS